MPKFRWRKTFRAVHRDVGYLVAALTLAYSISGVAVNHIEDWNPNYKFSNDPVNVGPIHGSYSEMQAQVTLALDIEAQRVKGHFMETDTQFRVFLTNTEEVTVNIETGKGLFKRVTTRPVLYQLNALHLNSIKGAWTWIADGFAVLLILLALTGIFMMKGKRGIEGRGKWFLGAGFAVPAVFIWYIAAGV